MQPDNETDQQLLARHVEGDPTAFASLVARHGDRLWAVALRTLGNPDDAADAVQDAWLSVHRGAATFRGAAAVTTWLHRIVVNACLDIARRRAARPADPVAQPPEPLHPDHPDATVERDNQLSTLTALRALPVEQAAAVVLVDIEGYAVAEAAAILEVPVGTVKSRCARARARLAPLLASPPGNEGDATGVQPPTSHHEEPA